MANASVKAWLQLQSLHAQVALHLLQHLLHIVVDLLGARLCRGLGPLRPLLCALRLPLRLRPCSVRVLLSAGSGLGPLSVSLATRAAILTRVAALVARKHAWLKHGAVRRTTPQLCDSFLAQGVISISGMAPKRIRQLAVPNASMAIAISPQKYLVSCAYQIW